MLASWSDPTGTLANSGPLGRRTRRTHRVLDGSIQAAGVALAIHQDEFGRGTWRTRELARGKYLARANLDQWDRSEDERQLILDADRKRLDWSRYAKDVLWIAAVCLHHGEQARAREYLLSGHDYLERQGASEEVAQIEWVLASLEGVTEPAVFSATPAL